MEVVVDESAGASALRAVEKVLGGKESGFTFVDGSPDGSIERFAVIPARGMPRLLLPVTGSAMRVALGSFLGERPWIGIASPLIRASSKIVGSRSLISKELSLLSESGARSPMRELLTSILGRGDFQLALRLSFGRPNAKTVIAAISDAGDILCFAKIGSETMTDDLVAHESNVLEKFANVDSPVLMPRQLYAGVWDGGGNVLITEPLQLESLSRSAKDAHIAADSFTAASLVATDTLKKSTYWSETLERIETLGGLKTQGSGIHDAISEIEAVWGDISFDFGPSHGDWSRANVGMVNGRVAALDWERCTHGAPRGLDTAHFALLEASSRSRGRSFDIERVAKSTQQYLASAGRPPEHAKPLIILDLLEMVVRFMTAQSAGLRTSDSKFEPALEAGLRNWSA